MLSDASDQVDELIMARSRAKNGKRPTREEEVCCRGGVDADRNGPNCAYVILRRCADETVQQEI